MSSKRFEDQIWTSLNGNKSKIKDLSQEHIRNIIKGLEIATKEVVEPEYSENHMQAYLNGVDYAIYQQRLSLLSKFKQYYYAKFN